ncbi:hypothetical protein CHS0354_017626 [Potamilus streckersoni]|uniref:SMP-30/Gluconolactonase/LRE-like region domain-containing protein n=1 Tax=Potamilus streckersoni TaxID=2493646 RepID=A0AAE0RP53_9BIVA|nr:hypothetical protein CHS0354_017626 [Potamilus streckersoni]
MERQEKMGSSMNISDEDVFKDVEQILSSLDNLSKAARTAKQLNFDSKGFNETQKTQLLKKASLFKARISELAERFEQHITAQIDTVNKVESQRIDRKIEECEALYNAIENTRATTQNVMTMKDLSTKAEKLTEVKHLCLQHKSALQNIHSQIEDPKFTLALDKELEKMLSFPSLAGRVIKGSDEDVEENLPLVDHQRQDIDQQNLPTINPAGDVIYIHNIEDHNDPMVNSIEVMHNGNLLAIDRSNDKVMMYRPNGKLIVQYVFTSRVWDMTLMDTTTLAVTLPDSNKIAILKFVDDFTTICAEKTIKTAEKCYGVCHVNNHLLVTCKGGEVKVLTLGGKEVTALTTSIRGVALFSEPQYITTNVTKTMLYVSDAANHSVTALRMEAFRIDRDPKFVYTSTDLHTPAGLALDAQGNIFACGFDSHNIHQISPDGKLIYVFLRGVVNPRSICFSHDKTKMYISAISSDKPSMHIQNLIRIVQMG